jgi:fibronectin-binding autotransporter adhesin
MRRFFKPEHPLTSLSPILTPVAYMKKTTRSFRAGGLPSFLVLSMGLSAGLLTLGSQSVQAANTWDGGGVDGNWSTATNWDNDLVPTFPVALTFAGTTGLTSSNDLSSLTVNGFTFNSGAGAFVIGGNGITLGGNVLNSSTSLQTLNNNIATTAVRTFTMTTGGGNIALGGNLSGTGGGITTAGTGMLTRSGSNSYTGITTVGAQTLRFVANGSNTVSGVSSAMSANSQLTTNNGSIVQLRADADTTFTASVLNPAGFATTTYDVGAVSTGSNNTLTLNSTSNFNVGANMIINVTGSDGDRLRLAGGNMTFVVNNTSLTLAPTSANVTVTNNMVNGGTGQSLVLNGTATDNIASGNITGSLAVTKGATAGVWSLSGANTYSGQTTVNNGGALRFVATGGNTTAGVSSAMSANSTLRMNESGALVQLRADADTTFTTSGLAASGGVSTTFDVGAVSTGSNNTLTLNSTAASLVGGAPNATMTFNVTGTNSDRLRLSGGNVSFADSGNTWVLNPTSANLTITRNLVTGTGTNHTLQLDGTSSDNVYGGNITDAATGVTKVNSGVWTLSGTNTYAGATNANAGTLIIGATGSLGASSAVTVANTATLTNNGAIGGSVTVNTGGTLNGSGSFGGAVTVDGNLNPGNSPGSQTFAAGLTLGAASVTTMEVAGLGGVAGTDFDFINVTGGTLTLDGSLAIVDFGGFDISAQTGTFNLFDLVAGAGDFDVVSVDGNSLTYSVGTDEWNSTVGDTTYNFAEGTGVLSVTVVPEPTAALLGGLGLLALLRRRREA